MTEDTGIRESTAEDVAAISALYPATFPDEDLLPLVKALLAEREGVISLVAFSGAAVTGHIAFTNCRVEGSGTSVALLGPLAVAPAMQGQGIGKKLISAGLDRLTGTGVAAVCVLGDPAYYSRSGFRREDGILPPYALPPEWDGAWQSRPAPGSPGTLSGRLIVPDVWNDKSLWSP